MASCTIFYTGDLHDRLTLPAAEKIRALRSEVENALLLDSGDAVGAGNLFYRPGGEPILQVMSDLGYDAMAMGNRESHPTLAVLKRKLAAARFPILAANLMAKRKPRPAAVQDYIIKVLPNGLRVAVFGLAPQITSPESWWSKVTDYVFDDPLKTAPGLAAKLRPQADLVICLSHCGRARDEELAKLPEVDAVIGGHSHVALETPDQVDGKPVAHAGVYGRWLGRLDLEVEGGRVMRAHGELIPIR